MSGKLVRVKNESRIEVLRTALGGTFSDSRIVEIANKQVRESLDRIMEKVKEHFGIKFTIDSANNTLRIRGPASHNSAGRPAVPSDEKKDVVVSWRAER